jgi:hypothetical protein
MIVVASSVMLSVAACGSVNARGTAASAVAVRMLTAVEAKDGTAACLLLAPDTASELEQSAGTSCTQAILDEDLPQPGEVTTTEVYGQWAQVHLSGDTVVLGAFPGGWRVVAAGCTARGDQPYDCTVQGG